MTLQFGHDAADEWGPALNHRLLLTVVPEAEVVSKPTFDGENRLKHSAVNDLSF